MPHSARSIHRTILLLLAVAALAALAGSCGDESGTTTTTALLAPDSVDWRAATTADVFAAAGVDAISQQRSIEISGTAAARIGMEGTITARYEQTIDPDALRITVDVSEELREQYLAGTAGHDRLVVVEDIVYLGTPDGTWVQPDEVTSLNPLLGPFQPLFDVLDDVVPGAGDGMDFVDYEIVNGRPALHFSGSDFRMTTEAGTVAPIDFLDVWIDEEDQFLLRAEMTTSGGAPDVPETVFSYVTTYDVIALAEPAEITSPVE